MKRTFVVVAGIAGIALSALVAVQAQDKFVPVTQKMLENPSPDDWLMYSRTYDAQRFSPLKQITKSERRAAEGSVQEGARQRAAREHSDRVSRRALRRSSRAPAIQAINGATGDDDLGIQVRRRRQLARQGAVDLRRHGLLHRARQLDRRARREDRRGALEGEDARRRRRPARSSSRARC